MLKIGHLEPNFELKSQKITNICPKSSKISPKWGYFCRAHIMNYHPEIHKNDEISHKLPHFGAIYARNGLISPEIPQI